MDDLLMGMSDWRNIQDVVRQTFKALHDVVRSQGEKIRQLEQQLNQSASAQDVDRLGVSMSNKATFVEVEKIVEARIEELNINSLRSLVAMKADKGDLKDLYGDMTDATQRIGEGSNALELLVRQQQTEIESLKAAVRKMQAMKDQEEEITSRFATRKWVEDNLAFESDVRKQNLTTLKSQIQEKIATVEKRVEDIPSISTLDEVFAQKVDMNTLSKVLQDRPTMSHIGKEISAKVHEMMGKILDQTGAAIRDASEVTLNSAKDEIERLEDVLNSKVSHGELLEVCGQKIGSQELEERIGSSVDALAVEVKEAIVGIQKELVQVLNKKVFKADLAKHLQTKANVDDVQTWLSTKVEIVDVRDSLAYKADVVALQELVSRIESLEGRRDKAKARAVRIQRMKQLHDRRRRGKSQTRKPSGGKRRGGVDHLDSYFDARVSDDSDQDENNEVDDEDDDDTTLAELEHGLERAERTVIDDEEAEGDLADVEEELNWKLRLVVRKLRQLSKSKATVKDVCALVDQKANIRDVNEALAKLGLRDTESGGKVVSHAVISENDPLIVRLREDLESITEAIHSELSTGRWIWSCGRVLSDRSVPWNVECVNTHTECFLWKPDMPDVTTVLPGLYEIQLGFFTQVDPEVQVLVNGEPIYYTNYAQGQQALNRTVQTNRSRGVAPNSVSVRRTQTSLPLGSLRRNKHSAGNVTGWTMTDFVALPSRARITVLYEGEMGAQGFFGLRKL